MRTDETWERKVKPLCLEIFPPRIKHDLETVPFPKDLMEGEAVSTFIYGGINTGKTVRASFMIMQEVKFHYLHPELKIIPFKDIHFVSFPELFAEIKSTFNNPNKREEDVMRKYLDSHLILLDDFLTTRPTDWVMDILYYLINHRYDYMKKTIITCNCSLEQLEKKLGDQRITSRINRMCEIEEKLPYD
jgi:DNA replication protein DnaC